MMTTITSYWGKLRTASQAPAPPRPTIPASVPPGWTPPNRPTPTASQSPVSAAGRRDRSFTES